MRGITFHINDEEEKERDNLFATNREIFLLGMKIAAKKQKCEVLAEPPQEE